MKDFLIAGLQGFALVAFIVFFSLGIVAYLSGTATFWAPF